MTPVGNRVLLVHRYYWPDAAPYAHMLRVIGGRLAADGHQVTVFTGPVTYNREGVAPASRLEPNDEGVLVHRVRLPGDDKRLPAVRALSLLMFACRLVSHAVRHRSEYDLMTVSTMPPVVMGLAARTIRRLTGLPFIYHCMDLYPEVLEVTRMSNNRALVRLARRVDTGNCKAASIVVVLSGDMAMTLRRRGLDVSNVVVLNNFPLVDRGTSPGDEALERRAAFRVTFAGNLGRFQGLDTILDAARTVLRARSDIEFVFMGSGVCADELRRRADDLWPAVRVVGQQPADVAAGVLEESDLGLVSLRPGMYRVAYPSKTAACLSAGCRVLAVAELDSELACLVTAGDLGSVCVPGDVDALVRALDAEIDRGPPPPAERARLRAVGNEQFGRDAKLDVWSQLVPQAIRRGHD